MIVVEALDIDPSEASEIFSAFRDYLGERTLSRETREMIMQHIEYGRPREIEYERR